jgi:Tfp pilus assembly protein PilF
MRLPQTCLLCAMALWPALGCQNDPSGPRGGGVREATAGNRDTGAARARNDEAARLLRRGDLTGAEREIRAAIAADPTFGPAHNNLGLIYFKQKKLYLAAQEFSDASGLMSNRA